MPLRPLPALAIFAIGFLGGLLGDSFHVSTGTTVYFSPAHAVPFLADSPCWFPFTTGLAALSIAATRAALPGVRREVDVRRAVGGVAAVLGLYALTAFLRGEPTQLSTTLVWAVAIIIWCVLGDRLGLLLALAPAIVGPAVEALLSHAGMFRYAADCDGLLGVAWWLPALYFAFGVVVSMLGELAARPTDAPA